MDMGILLYGIGTMVVMKSIMDGKSSSVLECIVIIGLAALWPIALGLEKLRKLDKEKSNT
jgi:hypothetical protein